jgi:hypothetical protein
MFRYSLFRRCAVPPSTEATAQAQFSYRQLSPGALLTVIRSEPGEGSDYYAKMFFGPGTEPRVKHMLWNDLKRYGHVSMQRDSDTEPPRWYPNRFTPPKAPQVRLYKAEEWDLSILKEMEKDVKGSQEVDVERQVMEERPKWGSRTVVRKAGGNSQTSSTLETQKSWLKELNDLATMAADAEQITPSGLPDQQTALPSGTTRSEQSSSSSFPDGVDELQTRVRAQLLRFIQLKPGQEMHSYIERLENEEEKSVAPKIFKQLRTDNVLQRTQAPGGEGFLWRLTPGYSPA